MKRTQIDEELRQIAARHNGLLRPEDVVEFAKDEETALHSRFQWDDDKAAQEYRLWQAREIIRVSVILLPNTSEPVRAFVSLKADRSKDAGGYRTIQNVMTDTEMREQLLEQALDDLEYFTRKYQQLKELAPVFDAITNIKGKKRKACA